MGKAVADVIPVGLVSSTGGLEALSRVLGPLPADFPGAIIGLQHQMPDHPSHLAEILNRRSAISVGVAEDGVRVARSRTYIAPPGKHVLLTREGTLALVTSGAYPPHRPSADLLLTSLALIAGPGAVAVVLSGTGNDGATGATAVHDFGGVVIAADEASSREFAMPSATIGRDDAVDHVLHVDDIAGTLQSIVSAMEESRPRSG